MTAPDTVLPAGDLSVFIPDGFIRMPLDDPAGRLRQVHELFADVVVGEQRALLEQTTGALQIMLTDLATAGALYCGVGRHESPTDGSLVTSTLVVSVLEFPGPSDPTALLQVLADTDREAGDGDSWEIGQTPSGRPVAYRQRVRSLPAPSIPTAQVLATDTAPVFQLEARVPSLDGSRLAAIELSTPYLSDGPQFTTMVLTMAATAGFRDEPVADE